MSNVEELVILRMGVLLSPPILVRRGIQEYRIPVSVRRPFSFDGGRLGVGPTETLAYFKAQQLEFLQFVDSVYRVLDYFTG
jgi:hypothetical protein